MDENELVEQAASACRASDLTGDEWMDAFGYVFDAVTHAKAEAGRWEERFFKMDKNFDRAVARAEAAEKERDALRESLRMADEIARVIIANPAGSLWNYGTKPSRLDEARWHGSREAAEDILSALKPLEPKND